MKKKIIYIRGLWSHPKATDWIRKNLEVSIGQEIELFDYHDLLVQNISNEKYVRQVIDKYGDFYGRYLNDMTVIGHSHGGTLSLLINKTYPSKKIILTNPALRPWGVLRRIPNCFKSISYNGNNMQEVIPHFFVKYEGEIEDRVKYFKDNFRVSRDTSRVMYTGSEVLKSLNDIRADLLLIQSMKDEFVSVSSNLKFYERLPISSNVEESPHKEIIRVNNAEHAVLEEKGEYQKIYKKVANFIRK